VGLADGYGPRVEAYKRLALATARFATEDFVEFKTDLGQAVGVKDPRFLARVALLRIAQGELQSAAVARTSIRWYAEKPQPHPLVKLVDAELFLARGLPEAALAEVGKDDGLRAAKLRGRALLDNNQPKEALIEFEGALEISPDDLEAQVLAEAAKMVSLTGDDRRKADQALDKLGRKAKSKAAKFVHGWALLATGQRSLARTKLEQSIDDLSDEYPNHLAYRSHVALAQLSAAEGKTDEAIEHAKKAVEQNGGYLPAHDVLGRLLVATNVEEARQHLIEVVNAEVATLGAELAYIKAIMPSKAKVDIDAATAAINRAKSKGASVPQLQEVIPLVDPALFEAWGIEPPKDK
jgi:tetratricopeptide (TPR) repeat protein